MVAPMHAMADLPLPDIPATDRLAAALAPRLAPGDTLLLSGELGAGKSHLARAVIQSRQRAAGAPPEDVPSPTYTLVQPYLAGGLEMLHADLYRLSDPSELAELGLSEALGQTLCLIEWPDRLGDLAPADALRLDLSHAGTGRRARLYGADDRWGETIVSLWKAAA